MILSVKKKYNYIPVLLIAMLMFLPMSTLGNLIRLAVAGGLAALKAAKKPEVDKNLLSLFGLMLASVAIPCATVMFFEGPSNLSIAVHEMQRFLFYVLLIYSIYEYKVPFKFIYWISVFVLLFNFTIQLLQYNGVTEVNDFIRQYYLVSGNDIHLTLAEDTGSGFRSGSIYLNPNVYMVIPSVILAVVLQANILKPSIINYVWAAVALGSLLLTGSRTTFFVAAGLLLIYFITDKNSKVLKWFILGGLLIALVLNFSKLQENFRVFEISSGMESSFGIKFSGLMAYLKYANPFYLLTGSLSSSLHVQIDSEWGYIFSYFGIAGLCWYVKYIKMLGENKKTVPFLANTVRIIICLIAMSATIVLCMPIFSFFCLIGLVDIEV